MNTLAALRAAPCPVSSLALLLVSALRLSGADAADYRGWPVYGGDPGGAKYSALDQINRGNVRRIQPAWIYRCDDMSARPASTIQCNPIVVDGVMYLTTPGLKVVALDAATGEERWVFDATGVQGRDVNRGVTLWREGDERRLFVTVGTFLYALDPQTGKPVKTFGTNGRIDLREGLDREARHLRISATSPGAIYRDILIIGSRVSEGPDPAAPGHIRGIDVRTGQRRWIFHTIPHPGEPGYETWPENAWTSIGGVNCWGGMTVDLRRGLVFAATGAPSYDKYGGNRIGQNLYANCVLALDAATGRRVWHYQTVHHDIWDYDLPCPPNLVTVVHGGRRVDAVAQATKMGHLFLLDRENGKPLFPVEERPVPASEVPGEQAWPTQPFPTKPAAYARQGFSLDDITDLSAESRAQVMPTLREMRTGELFTPPGLTPTAIVPQFNGGTNWGGAAFDPETRLLYVNSSNELEWTAMEPAAKRGQTIPQLGRTIHGSVCSVCHAVDQPAVPLSSGAAATSLANVSTRLTREQVLAIIEQGRGQMPPFPSFSAIEKRAIVAFLFGDAAGEKVPAAELNARWASGVNYLSVGHRELRDAEGFPANKRPWGTLTAIDLDAGEIRWQVPLGTYPVLEARGLPPTGTFNMGGPLVTAGGLVFIGAAMDERFHAFDKSTGELIWEFQLEAGGYATPATYEIDGRQFVVIAAGGGGKPGTQAGNAYYSFALPEK